MQEPKTEQSFLVDVNEIQRLYLPVSKKKNTEDDFHLPSNCSGGKQVVCGKRRTGKFSEGSRQRLYQVGICSETTITPKMQEDVK